MKKILAIMMAVVMMMAIAVPAFAAADPIEVTKDSAVQGGDVVVRTTYDDTKDWSYTVEIPANIDISWNDSSEKDMSYKVTSQLLIGASLKISVTATNGTVLTSGDKELPYTFTTVGEKTFAEVNDAAKNPDGTDTANTTVQVSEFTGYAVGEYTDTLTYTVVYNAPATV